MFTPELRRRLSEIARGKSLPQPDITPEPSARVEYATDFAFSGKEEQNEHGVYFVCDYRMADLLSDSEAIAQNMLASCESTEHNPEQLIFLDLETCGLAGVPVFLIGTMQLDGKDFTIRQFFARDYSEETCILQQVRHLIEKCEGLITFNGKAFDVPFLRDRMIVNKVCFALPRVHHDLIHGARRKWKGSLPDCRLQTLEVSVCGRRRSGDIPGGEIPRLYHEYVKTGDITPLIPVFKHNVLDLMTMAELFPKIIR